VEPPSASSTASGAAQASIAKRIGGRDRALVWDDVAWLKSQCNLPILLKGVVTYADAKLAVRPSTL
jgi:isopentenyl diphosphate isomerase/L-lactate dehydrogenase-like FMN-dependent dehydrogenase